MRIAAILLGIAGLQAAAQAEPILFVGNSFTAGSGSPVEHYRPETVTDLNREGIGGVPALFAAFARQANLAYDVHLEVAGGMNLNYHSRSWRHLARDHSAPGDWPRIDVVPHAVEEYGHERIMRFRCDGPAAEGSDGEVNALLSGRDAVAVGEPLRLGVDTAHLHFFDPDSGNALA